MIPQRRKSYETSVVASERLAACTSDAERVWWRLSLATDAYGTVDITDVRRLRLAILGEVHAIPTNVEFELAIEELIGRGLLVEWYQLWNERIRRFLHVVNHDPRQTVKWIRDRNRSEGRPSPVPPFACCDHANEQHDGAEVTGLRGNARHCPALRGIARQVDEPAWGLDARHCPATPSRAEVRREEKAGEDRLTEADLLEILRQRQELDAEEAFLPADQRIGSARSQSAAVPVAGEGEPLDANRRDLAARAHPDTRPRKYDPFAAPDASLTTERERSATSLGGAA